MSAPSPFVQATRELGESVDQLHRAVRLTNRMLDERLPRPRPLNLDPPTKPWLRGLLALVPGAAEQFTKQVPATHVVETKLEDGQVEVHVTCCSGPVLLSQVGELVDCPTPCGRWFLRTEIDVRVAKYDVKEIPDRYAGPGWTPLP